MPDPVSHAFQLKPGDLYEDAFYHPCVAIVVQEDEVCGISLADGSYPRCVDLQRGGVRKLSPAEAWQWRLTGPADATLLDDLRWWTPQDHAEYERRSSDPEQESHHTARPVLYFDFDTVPFSGDTYIVKIPSGLTQESELHSVLATRMMFPGWYGHNWDALWDVLCDLSWTNYHRVMLEHVDLPLANAPHALAKYLRIVHDAGERWQQDGTHDLVALFPHASQSQVIQLLGQES